MLRLFKQIAEGLNKALFPEMKTTVLLETLPFILETPNDDEGYIQEIATVQGWFK